MFATGLTRKRLYPSRRIIIMGWSKQFQHRFRQLTKETRLLFDNGNCVFHIVLRKFKTVLLSQINDLSFFRRPPGPAWLTSSYRQLV